MKLDQIDLFEINEAFASVVAGLWSAKLHPDMNRRQRQRRARSPLGHPLGCSGRQS